MTVTQLQSHQVWCTKIQQMVQVEGKVEFASLPKLHIESCEHQHTCKQFERASNLFGKVRECKVGMVLWGKW